MEHSYTEKLDRWRFTLAERTAIGGENQPIIVLRNICNHCMGLPQHLIENRRDEVEQLT